MHFKEIVSILKKISHSTNIEFYIVGGAVRDNLLQKDDIDNIDIAVINDFDRFTDSLTDELGINKERVKRSMFKTALIEYNGITIDIVTARREMYGSPGALPEILPSGLNDDLLRRDFTINSIAYDVKNDTLIDPLNGISDLKSKVLKADRENLFIEDPTRIFRYFKYKCRFSLSEERGTKEQIEIALNAKSLFLNVSKSRISKEWILILNEDKRREIIESLLKNNVFGCIFGEDTKADVNFQKNQNTLIETLNIFYENETETLIKILDTLLNGLKMREESAVRRMKTESKSFDCNNENIAFLQLK